VSERAGHRVVGRETWLNERAELLAAEKELTRQRDAVAARRRELPWVRVETPYRFHSEAGDCDLADLFDGHGQLIVWHFMYGVDWHEGCPSCSFWADGYDGLRPHLAARDTAIVAVSRAPLDQLLAYRSRMGWSFPWVSSEGSSFNADYGVSDVSTYNYADLDTPVDELPGLSVFARDGADVFHTYSCYSRGLDQLNAAYAMLDLTPKGRDEAELPWPMAWLRRHDEY
jgi:predicted dithiol-disulfide oxidoreductase (DUF899 family)